MLGRYSMANNARVALSAAAVPTSTSLTFAAAVAPFANPADPAGDTASGGYGIATLTDSLSQPTKFEIVLYTSLTNNGNGTYTIAGLLRGSGGSTAQSWAVGAILYQALTKDGLMHPFFTANQSAGALAINASSVDFGSANVTMASLNATSVTATAVNVGAAPSIAPTSAFAAQTGTDDASSTSFCARYSNNILGPTLVLAKARGTPASQQPISITDTYGTIAGYGARTSTTWSSNVEIALEADGTQNGSSSPGRIVFRTRSPAISGGNLTEAMRITSGNAVVVAGAFSVGGLSNLAGISASTINLGTTISEPAANPLLTMSGVAPQSSIVGTGNTNEPASLNLAKGRGISATTGLSNGDVIGAINYIGRASSAGWVQSAGMNCTVWQAGSTFMRSTMTFQACGNASTTPIDMLAIGENGAYPVRVATGFRVDGVASCYRITVDDQVIVNGTLFAVGNLSMGGTLYAGAVTIGWWNTPNGIAGATLPSSTVNNVAVPTTGAIRFTGAGNGTWSGLAGTSQQIVTLFNAGSGTLTLSHENAGSLTANRFTLPGNTSYSIGPNDSVTLWYDPSSSRWRVKR